TARKSRPRWRGAGATERTRRLLTRACGVRRQRPRSRPSAQRPARIAGGGGGQADLRGRFGPARGPPAGPRAVDARATAAETSQRILVAGLGISQSRWSPAIGRRGERFRGVERRPTPAVVAYPPRARRGTAGSLLERRLVCRWP